MSQKKEKYSDLGSPTGGQGAVFLIGFMGCGKTYWGRQLAQKLQLPFFDLDEKIVEKEERSIRKYLKQKARNTSGCWKKTCCIC